MIAKHLRAASLLMIAAMAFDAQAGSTFVIVDPNAAGLGTSDTTPATPVAGNPGTTRGAQRLYLLQTAGQKWGALLDSAVPIRYTASMVSNTCSGSSAVVASTLPSQVFSDFANAPRPDTWYGVAEASALAGEDLATDADDFDVTFNSDVDNGSCLTGYTGWWYGVDPSVPVPADKLALLPIMLREFARGVGAMPFVEVNSGDLCCDDDPKPDAWIVNMYDTDFFDYWSTMDSGSRESSSNNDPFLVWAGTHVNRHQAQYLHPQRTLVINTPASIAGSNPAKEAVFGPPVPPAGITGNIVLAVDGSTADSSGGNTGTLNDACQTIADATGKIVLAERGACTFVQKAQNAQAAHALGLVVMNNVDPDPAPMGGTAIGLTMPSLGITQALGTDIRNHLNTAVNVTMGSTTIYPGTTEGCVRLSAPIDGSLFSPRNFSADITPDLLIRGNYISYPIHDNMDLLPDVMKDIGWHVGSEIHADGFEGNPCAYRPAF